MSPISLLFLKFRFTCVSSRARNFFEAFSSNFHAFFQHQMGTFSTTDLSQVGLWFCFSPRIKLQIGTITPRYSAKLNFRSQRHVIVGSATRVWLTWGWFQGLACDFFGSSSQLRTCRTRSQELSLAPNTRSLHILRRRMNHSSRVAMRKWRSTWKCSHPSSVGLNW